MLLEIIYLAERTDYSLILFTVYNTKASPFFAIKKDNYNMLVF